MKAAKLTVLAIATLFLVVAFWAPTAAAIEIFPLLDDDSNGIEGPDQGAEQASEAEVKMFFRGATVTPSRATGNSSEEITQCPSLLWGGRFKGTVIGQWSATIAADTTVAGAVNIALWARSTASAKNAGFRINLYRSNGNMQAYFTNRQDIAANPVKFTAEGTYNQQFTTGDTFDVQLVWLSDPNLPVGPTGPGEFLYGNRMYDSHVKIVFNPHPISIQNITLPNINGATMDIRAEFTDYLKCDPSTMEYSIAVSGAGTASPANLLGPDPSSGGEISTVSWTWNHKADSAKNGEYAFTVGISYDGNASMVNTTTLKVKIPKSGESDGGIFGEDGLDMTMIIAIVVVVVVVAVIAVVIMKRRKRAPPAEEEEDED